MGKDKKLLTIDSEYALKEYDVPSYIQLKERENHVVAGNVIFPYDFFAAIQLCNEKQYKVFKEGLA